MIAASTEALVMRHIITLSITYWAIVIPALSIPAPTETVAITSAPPYSAIGELYILQANTNAPGLQNPVLVVEGFDIGNSMNWPELYELLNKENLIGDIQQYGRDLVVMNFGDSTIDILANTALTETAIEYINANRIDLTDKFTAVGASLGGLTVRKALVDMPDHDVDTWISFDAPHEGANIPLGVQEYLEFFAPQNVSASNLLAVLDRPAARQMLVAHHTIPNGLTGGSAPEFADFFSLMNAAGYPTSCKGIAISNGSGFGDTLPFNPGDQIIHWTDSGFLKPTINVNVYALPRTSSTVFSGSIYFPFIINESTTVNSYHPLSFDNAPGGTRSTFLDLFTNIPPDQISGDDYLTQTNHCFIPTVSALGIPIENLESNLSANAALLALSPFDEIHYAVSNEAHVEINARNKRWIVRAILENHDTDDDGYDDYEEYLIGTAYDSPDSTLMIHAILEVALVDGTAVLSWNAYSNTQYAVSYSEALGDPWQPIETIAPTNAPAIARAYLLDTEAPSGFFKITGTPIDPVTD
jgi:hypothetical protein